MRIFIDDVGSVNDIIKIDATNKKLPWYMSKTLSLPKNEQELLSTVTQCLSKILSSKKSNECLEYLVSKVAMLLAYDKCYVLKFDIGDSKLRQVSDRSCIDVPLKEKVSNQVASYYVLKFTYRAASLFSNSVWKDKRLYTTIQKQQPATK